MKKHHFPYGFHLDDPRVALLHRKAPGGKGGCGGGLTWIDDDIFFVFSILGGFQHLECASSEKYLPYFGD